MTRQPPAPAWSAAAHGCGPASTTRCCSAGTRSSSPRSPRPPPRSTATTGCRRRARTPGSCSASCATPTVGSAVRWRAPYLAYAEDYAALLEALLTLAELDDIAWLADARVVADELLRLFLDPDARRVLHDRPRRRGARRPAQGSLRRRDAVGELAGGQRAAALAHAHRRRALRRTGGRDPRDARRPDELAPDRIRVSARRARTPRARADRDRDRRRPRRPRARARCAPRSTRRLVPASVMLVAPDADDAIPLLADRPARDVPTAYVCEHYACREPVTDTRGATRAARRGCCAVELSDVSRRRRTSRPPTLRRPPNRTRSSPCRASRRGHRRARRSSRHRWPSPGWRRGSARTSACGSSRRR